MKKIQFVFVVAFVLCITRISFGQEKTFYAGLGFANGYETFRTDMDFNNTHGFTGRIGRYFDDKLAFEGEYRSLPGFESESSSVLGQTVKTEVDIEAYLLSIKYDPYTSQRMDIYVNGSVGWMNVEIDSPANDLLDGSSSDLCLRAGFGVDYFLLKTVAVKLEGGSVFGTGDVSDFRFSIWTLGLTLFFF